MAIYDLIIVGAGVAGSTIATTLARHGRRVALIERDLREPQLFVGELLQPGGVCALEALGMTKAIEGIDAQPVQGFAVSKGEEGQSLSYPVQRDQQGRRKPIRGYAFHHGRFIQRLRETAKATAGVELIQGTVTSMVEKRGRVSGVKYRDRQGVEHELSAHLVVASDGRNSKLRKGLAGAKPEVVSHSIGVMLHGARLPFEHHGNLFIAQPAPMLAYRIGSDDVRILVDLPGALPSRSDGSLAKWLLEVALPQLSSVLRPAFRQAVINNEYRVMPARRLRSKPKRRAGAVILGDALNMRHPLTGSGMTVALNDTRVLTELLDGVAMSDHAAVEKCVQRFYRARKPLSITVDMLAGALYDVFRAERPGLDKMREAMLRYWQIGGPAVNGPMSLLSGLAPQPSKLAVHYLAVALVGVGSTLMPRGYTPRRLSPDLIGASRLTLAALGTLRDTLPPLNVSN